MKLIVMFKKIFSIILLFTACNVFAADPIYTSFFSDLAIKGYDPVAYFKESKAVAGSKQFEFEWMGATWRFSSGENLNTFKANPEKYSPQYGGYCAYAVSQDSLAGIDPTQFTIVNDKLYLNYNAKIQKEWLSKRDTYIKDADKNWPAVLQK